MKAKPTIKYPEIKPQVMELREAITLPGMGLSIPVRAAKAKFSALLELVAGGQEVTITSDGKRKRGIWVRIIAGGWRGRRVNFPDIPGLRPTPDRVRETLFNWLQQSIVQTRCLDLFAGSGALGLEALSRGAREVVFVEYAAVAANALKGELARLGGGARAQVVQMAAARFLSVPG